MNMKRNLFSKVSIASFVLLMACSESLLDRTNPNGDISTTFYSNADQLTQGVNAVYAVLQSYDLAGREFFFNHDMRSDDVQTGGGQLEAARFQILNGSLNSANPVMTASWTGYYTVILRANQVIDGSANAKNVDATLVNRIVAEARFLRAWAYSDLVIFWGSVPMPIHVATTLAAASLPKTSVSDINTFMISELSAIQADLPASYSGADLGRATKGAAQALLARVYMTQGDYANAKTELLKVYNSGTYSLMPNYFDNFKEETGFNKESIFEVGYNNTNFNWNGVGDGFGNEGNARTQEYSAVGWRNLIPSDGLVNEYEAGDPRFAANFIKPGDTYNNGTEVLLASDVQGNTVNYHGVPIKISWNKYTAAYKMHSSFYTGPMNMRIIRYAEILANLAECENEVGTGTQAMVYLNMIRSRPSVNMPPVVSGSKAQNFAAIQHERRVEFAGEQIRNRDILRWRKNGKLTGPDPISYFTPNKFELFPIPQQEFAANGALNPSNDQNPGY
jgi:hypothetical protein